MAEITRVLADDNPDDGSEYVKNSDPKFVERLKLALNGETTHAFSRRTGIPDSTLRNYLGGTMPGLKKLLEIAEATEVTLDWLAAERGPMRLVETDVRVPTPAAFHDGDDLDAFTLVPRMGVSASAGHGLVALAEEITERLAFKTEWLREMGLSPRNAGLLTAAGNSMAPAIPDGALLLVDLDPDQKIRSGCYYVLVLDGDVLVKLVNRKVDGTIELISVNTDYPTERISSQDLDKLTIPGRVVWIGHKL